MVKTVRRNSKSFRRKVFGRFWKVSGRFSEGFGRDRARFEKVSAGSPFFCSRSFRSEKEKESKGKEIEIAGLDRFTAPLVEKSELLGN